MSMSDPIADFLTRIRNATMRHHPRVNCPASKVKAELARVLKAEGFIDDWDASMDDKGKPMLSMNLKYDNHGASVIRGLQRVSKPGLRRYAGYQQISPVLNGQGVAIISTSSGIMTDLECRERKVGGEVLCEVW